MFAKIAVTALQSRLFNENLISVNRFKRRISKKAMTAIFQASKFSTLLFIIVFSNISFFKFKVCCYIFEYFIFDICVFSNILKNFIFEINNNIEIFKNIIFKIFSDNSIFKFSILIVIDFSDFFISSIYYFYYFFKVFSDRVSYFLNAH